MELKEIAENIEYNTGLDVKPSHIKTSENWVFLYRKDLFDSYGEKEVECFLAPMGPPDRSPYEAYDILPYDQSPFSPDKEVRSKSIEKINQEYVSHLKSNGELDEIEKFLTGKRPFGHGLLAVSGDCGGSMSKEHDLIVLNGDNFDAVEDYLRYELEWSFLLTNNQTKADWEKQAKFYQKKSNQKIRERMATLNIFKHKYHFRTTWELVSLTDSKPNRDCGFDLTIIKQEQGKFEN